jgi:hypothetical protein
VLVSFTNTGSEKATYKVVLTSPEGSAANPITMKDGSVTVKVEAGNNRGVYYQYKAPYEGSFTLECKNTVNYTVTIKNLNGNETATLDKNTKKASIDVRKNDSSNEYQLTAASYKDFFKSSTNVLCRIGVVVSEEVKSGDYDINVSNISFTIPNLTDPTNPTSIEQEDFTAKLTVALKGDIDGDGILTITDAVRVLEGMASGDSPDNCDLNEDGKVNVTDYVVLLALMAGL